jgi:hypothetical protein
MSINVVQMYSALKEGACNIHFRKIDTGELRIMASTLNRDIAGHSNLPEIFNQDVLSDHLVVWCLDKDAYRSFRVRTVEHWEEIKWQEKEVVEDQK